MPSSPALTVSASAVDQQPAAAVVGVVVRLEAVAAGGHLVRAVQQHGVVLAPDAVVGGLHGDVAGGQDQAVLGDDAVVVPAVDRQRARCPRW